MKTVNANTKKAQAIMNSYNNGTNATSIHAVYERPSRAKAIAFQTCEALRNQFNGYAARITGYSTHFFSYAFKYTDAATDTEHLVYVTHANNYDIALA